MNKFAISRKVVLLFAAVSSISCTQPHFPEEIVLPERSFVEEPDSRFYSHFRDQTWSSNPKRNIILQNLANKISSLPSCANHIINYNGIDLPSFTTPVILSRYDVVHVKYQILQGWKLEKPKHMYTNWKRLFTFEQVSGFLVNKTNEIKWCRRVSVKDDLECFDIPFVDNSPKSRGWHCESHWYLFPPNPIEAPLFYEGDGGESTPTRLLIPGSYKKFWSHARDRVTNESDITTWRLCLLKTRQIFDIIVTKMEAQDYFTMKAWTRALSTTHNNMIYEYTTTAREELTFQLILKPSVNPKNELQSLVYILKTTILFCRHCKQFIPFQPVIIGEVFSKNELEIWFKLLNSPTDNIHWTIFVVGGLDEAYLAQNTHDLLYESPYNFLLSHGELYKSQWRDLEHARFRVETRLLLQTVVGNGSFESVNFWLTEFRSTYWHGDIPKETKFTSPQFLAMLSGTDDYGQFEIHRMNLKFVSCGIAKKHELAFNQLASIFDWPIWLWIGISMVAMTTVFYVHMAHSFTEPKWNGCGTMSTFFNSFMLDLVFMGKALLEQGDPIATKFLKFHNLRWAIVPYLLIAMVLSNAYKNKNITTITLPRAPIPVDTFDAVEKYNFTMYTIANPIGGYKSIESMHGMALVAQIGGLLNVDLNTLKRTANMHNAVILPSQLYTFILGEYTYLQLFNEDRLNLSTTAKEMLNYTKIHPQWATIMQSGTPTYVEILEKCNQTALFLPDVDAHQTYYKLRRNGTIRRKVYISENEMFRLTYKFSFGRWLNQKILSKIMGLESSGILDWWSNLIVNYMSRLRATGSGESEEVSSNLDGNISVIFVVLAVGLAGCIAIFAIEVRKLILNLAIVVFNHAKALFNSTKVKIFSERSKSDLLQ